VAENTFMVGAHGDDGGIVILAFGRKLTHAQAINLAAWLVALSDWSKDHAEFHAALKEALDS